MKPLNSPVERLCYPEIVRSVLSGARLEFYVYDRETEFWILAVHHTGCCTDEALQRGRTQP